MVGHADIVLSSRVLIKRWSRFALYNAAMGLIVGILIAATAKADDHWLFIAVAPVAAFITGGLLWRLFIGEQRPVTVPRVLLTGLLTGTVSHYIAWLLLSVALNLTYWTFGIGGGSLNDPPAGVWEMLPGGFLYSFFSLLFYGWLTVPGAIVCGMLVRWHTRDRSPGGLTR